MKTLKELKEWARKEGIMGFSRMRKPELLDLWQESQPEQPLKYIMAESCKRRRRKTLWIFLMKR